MRKTKLAAVLFGLGFLMLFFFTPQAYAVDVRTANGNGTVAAVFNVGDDVRIIVQSSKFPESTVLSVIVSDPDGRVRYMESAHTFRYDRTLTGMTDKPGWWVVTVTEGPERTLSGDDSGNGSAVVQESTEYLATVQNVVPEVPLGTITIVLTFLAAFGVIALRKRSHGASPQVSLKSV
jgi:hypothetical protein